ncbi:hypothetical protein [Lichenibacterium dinghuense]|uniref:hypothetical protein n=1 Tax=Lichenibacterium dinghuense TaxID=2895977 RepID=UPI001F1757E0|nr:hypothetical protein [Lichenibacterium sp. 6Y81]
MNDEARFVPQFDPIAAGQDLSLSHRLGIAGCLDRFRHGVDVVRTVDPVEAIESAGIMVRHGATCAFQARAWAARSRRVPENSAMMGQG